MKPMMTPLRIVLMSSLDFANRKLSPTQQSWSKNSRLLTPTPFLMMDTNKLQGFQMIWMKMEKMKEKELR